MMMIAVTMMIRANTPIILTRLIGGATPDGTGVSGVIPGVAKKAINNGKMLISREQARFLFHDLEAERISFKDNSMISATTPRTPS